ncbi:hypothetical protein [Aquabacterium humicola]|uniref:hypothetical protein n=1 Tax=Aquabacterium humicola TaxID=3237377 RepID=UPI00254301BC|nr:hypothetical protein [Rubrivivax pictus]
MQITRLLSELTKLTSKGQLTWQVSDPPESLTHGTNDVYPLFLQSEYKEQRIGLAQRRYQAFDGDNERFYWTEELVFMFIDWRGRVTWETRSSYAALYTLFEAAREQVADVDGILKKLLSDSDDEL